MTNAERLAKEMLEDLDDFAKILFNGICTIHGCCDACPLSNAPRCCNEKAIKKWLESEVEEDAPLH